METKRFVVPGPGMSAAQTGEAAARLRGGAAVVWDVGAVTEPGLGAVDALARLALAARRGGGVLTVTGAGAGLLALLRLTGLAGLVEVPGEVEEREPAGGVEEGVEAGDPAP
ncbi:hypothetical protein ABZY31_02700 [Streptomyces sp. NPDC006529]|uniref:hypothetical protein n=1 Tax=Streptomyces sp. NPDC006529 TaxID=3157177 RepID=UPI0033A4A06A